MWLTADVFIKRKMLLFGGETDVKMHSKILQTSDLSRPHCKLQHHEEFSWTKLPIAFDESRVLPITYLLYFSLKNTDFVMMEDCNIWLHCTWQGFYPIHKMFQLNMAILMCTLDRKIKTEIGDHSAFQQYRNQTIRQSTILVNTAAELAIQKASSIQLHPIFWILN